MSQYTLSKQWREPFPNIFQKFVAEASACMIFHFIGSVAGSPWANGLSLMVLVYYSAKISGAHLNPALSLTFTLLGYTNLFELFVYWTAQVLGCIIGASWIKLLVPNWYIVNETSIGCFSPNNQLSNAMIFGWEAICTFTFLLPIFTVVWYTTHKIGYGNTGPLIVGLSLIASALAAAPFTGAALNPARVLGSMIIFNCDKTHVLYYILGEFTGALMVPLCVFPFYGINNDAWYLNLLSYKQKTWLEGHQSNVKIRNSRMSHEDSSIESPQMLIVSTPPPIPKNNNFELGQDLPKL
jgi:aquaporin TIP